LPDSAFKEEDKKRKFAPGHRSEAVVVIVARGKDVSDKHYLFGDWILYTRQLDLEHTVIESVQATGKSSQSQTHRSILLIREYHYDRSGNLIDRLPVSRRVLLTPHPTQFI